MGPDLDLNKDDSRDGGPKTTLALSPQGQIWPVEALGPPSRLQMYIRQYRSWYYLDKKLRIICSPFGVMMDSGWNCTP